jgi:steroid delta-isomerase
MPTREQITTVVEAYVDAVGRQDIDAVLSLFAVDARQEDPVGSPVNTGEAIREFFERSFSGSFETELEEVLVNGDHTAFRFTITIPTKGDPMVVKVVDLALINEDLKIQHLQAVPDFG